MSKVPSNVCPCTFNITSQASRRPAARQISQPPFSLSLSPFSEISDGINLHPGGVSLSDNHPACGFGSATPVVKSRYYPHLTIIRLSWVGITSCSCCDSALWPLGRVDITSIGSDLHPTYPYNHQVCLLGYPTYLRL